MALNKFVKGQTDYTEKMNENFEGLADGSLLPEGTAIAKDGLTQMESISIEQVSDDIVNFDEFYSKGLAFGSSEKPTAKEKLLDVTSMVSKERGDVFLKVHGKDDFANRMEYIARPQPYGGLSSKTITNGVQTAAASFWDSGNLPVESGTWTPELVGATFNYASRNGTYSVVGNHIYVYGYISVASWSSPTGEQIRIRNFPLVGADLPALSVSHQNLVKDNFFLYLEGANATAPLLSSVFTAITTNNLNALGLIVFSGVYRKG